MDTKYNPYSLEGKRILITGASSGIGRATAIECSKLRAELIITARNKERLYETFEKLEGEGHNAILADLIVNADIEKLVNGSDCLDGIVLCAGQVKSTPFKMSKRERINPIFEINYFSPIELLRSLLCAKKIAENASVVFVSSIGGVESFTIGNGIYGASKAALNSTMKYCALELAAKKIRVNSVNPGMVNTNLINGGSLSEEQKQTDMQKYPLKRYGEPVDIAYGIIYLLSNASSWVTGHSLVIDGGVTI